MASHATTLEELVMPGPVIEGHAKIETECGKCHEPFSKTKQSSLCVACHKETGSDITDGRGFHGRIKNIATTECKQCHSEHKGRDADIVRLDRETFDHGATDFPLKGAHKGEVCKSCHAPETKFNKAPATCIACHKTDDRHKGRLGDKCANCHTETNWREARFDHDRATKFPLVGRHDKVVCAACHMNENYSKTPRECVACHRLNDVHAGSFGKECEKCHVPDDWRRVKFDHDRQTKFPLKGAHKSATCRACHSEKIFGDKLGSACIDCHRNDDEHKGRNGPKCDSCHSVTNWGKSRFNHDKDTRFPLREMHANLACETCHKGSVFKDKLGTSCNACHASDDVHKGRLGDQCERCHNVGGWAKKVFFDHDLTRFPLIGLHAVVPCEECHLAATYKGTSLECTTCHEKSDTHKRRLGTQCGSCHNPNGWALWRFDHTTQTKFTLDGGHKGLLCDACHRKPVRKEISMNSSCNSCHSGDDIHNRRFGQRCERCHVTSSFKEIRLNQ
ncbi:MAG: cytochrome C [Alphaproteobacteria bacterium]|nr:cytochrome C [Alphaproteobacteria bacterium]